MINIYNGFLPRQVRIESLTKDGFRFDAMRHNGALLALPSGMKAWSFEEFTEESFAEIIAEKNNIDILIIGTGAKMRHLPIALQIYLRENGIGFDCQASIYAIATYNILLEEKRQVAGCFMI